MAPVAEPVVEPVVEAKPEVKKEEEPVVSAQDKKKSLVESFAEEVDGDGAISDDEFQRIIDILRSSRNRNNK